MRMAASSPVWFTRSAEARKARCSVVRRWIGLEELGSVGGEELGGGAAEVGLVAAFVGGLKFEALALAGVGALDVVLWWCRRWRGRLDVRAVMIVRGARKSSRGV